MSTTKPPTSKQLAEMINSFDDTLHVTEYDVQKSRLSDEQKVQLCKEIATINQQFQSIDPLIVQALKQVAKAVVEQSHNQPSLWPSLDGSLTDDINDDEEC
jgi:hypothetical protein